MMVRTHITRVFAAQRSWEKVRISSHQEPQQQQTRRPFGSGRKVKRATTTKLSSDVKLAKNVEDALERFSTYKVSCLTLHAYTHFGLSTSSTDDFRLQSARYVHNEGSVRLAHMVKELQSLPQPLREHARVRELYGWYLQSFEDLVTKEKINAEHSIEKQREYTDTVDKTIEAILERHSTVVVTMAQVVREFMKSGQLSYYSDATREFLDRFYMGRIGIRFLFQQHLGLFNDTNTKDSKVVGSIAMNCDVASIAEDAFENASMLCDNKYGDHPKMVLKTPGFDRTKGESLTFTYIPSHIYHILFELMKNSCRAVMEYHEDADELPPIHVIIVQGKRNVSIQISDQGGGIDRDEQTNLFTYLYSTADNSFQETGEIHVDMNHAPMAGLGYGLALSRLYARYFGGDLTITSMENYGTSATIFLKSDATSAMEVLPSYNSAESDRWQRDKNHWMRERGKFYERAAAQIKG